MHGGSLVLQYFGIAFLLVATIVALLPVSEIAAAADDESSGRLVHLLAQPLRRTTLLGVRIALAAVTIVATGLLTGVAAWLGAKTQGVDPGLGRMAGAGFNVVPTALVVLGIGVLVFAIAPRAATGTVYGVVVASLFIDLLTALVSGTSWLDRVSLFHYMALAPAAHIDARAVIVTLVLAAACCGVGLALFRGRRDRTEGLTARVQPGSSSCSSGPPFQTGWMRIEPFRPRERNAAAPATSRRTAAPATRACGSRATAARDMRTCRRPS